MYQLIYSSTTFPFPLHRISMNNNKGGNKMGYNGGGYNGGSTFALIVVLFILLIIVGAAYVN